MPELPSGTVTFVFTDIEDSTELMKRLGEEYAGVLTAHRRIIRDSFHAQDGIEMDTQGDAFFFVFHRARAAVAAAVEAQREHAAAEWPGGGRIRVRMGLHTGEPTVHDEGYVGLDVVRAARICTLGHGGHILLSETTRALLGSGLPDGVSIFPIGQRHLRGIDEPERVFEVAIEDLPEDEPHVVRVETDDARAPAAGPDDVSTRFHGLGARLAADIQERVLGALGGRPAASEGAADGSGVDDIASRMASLGDEIDARISAALERKGILREDG